jgi:hypothetical protein
MEGASQGVILWSFLVLSFFVIVLSYACYKLNFLLDLYRSYLLPEHVTSCCLRISFSAHKDLNIKFQSNRSRYTHNLFSWSYLFIIISDGRSILLSHVPFKLFDPSLLYVLA